MTIDSIVPCTTALVGAYESDLEAQILETNCMVQEADDHFWVDRVAGRQVARRVLQRFVEVAGVLEARGWSRELIKGGLQPSRQVFATSPFMQRCQEWPRGYAGDFETIEYLVAGVNRSVPETLGWHIECLLLESPVVQQHRNKLLCQSQEIAGAVTRSRSARVLSIGCGGCLDWIPILPQLNSFAGEIVLNDTEPAALELADQRLRSATTHYRLAPGNVIRIAKRLADCPGFDLVLAGGLFDYLSHRATVSVLRVIYQDLLTPGGVLLFTNIAEGNPWRLLMEYGSDWLLIERSESHIFEICSEAGMPSSAVSVKREDTGLTLITRVVR
jgi:SAM-dependent methyltransferase